MYSKYLNSLYQKPYWNHKLLGILTRVSMNHHIHKSTVQISNTILADIHSSMFVVFIINDKHLDQLKIISQIYYRNKGSRNCLLNKYTCISKMVCKINTLVCVYNPYPAPLETH